MRAYVAFAAVTATGLFALPSFAQISTDDGAADDGATDSVPVESDPVPQPTAPASPPAAAAPTAAETGDTESDDEYEEIGGQGGARFRWGVSGMVGPSFGVSPVAVFGADIRFGAQVNDVFGFYAQPMFQLGVGFSTDDDNYTQSFGQAMVGMAAMFDLTFSDFIYLAVGPEYVTGVVGLRDAAGTDYGPFFSVASRLGVVLGKKKNHRRKGLALGLDTRVIMVDSGVVVSPLLSAGYEYF